MTVLRRKPGAVVGLNCRIISNVCAMKHTSVNRTYCKRAVKNAAKSHKKAQHNVQNYETHSYPIVDTTKNTKV